MGDDDDDEVCSSFLGHTHKIQWRLNNERAEQHLRNHSRRSRERGRRSRLELFHVSCRMEWMKSEQVMNVTLLPNSTSCLHTLTSAGSQTGKWLLSATRTGE